MMQVFAFNISGTATQQAATCQQLCQLLQQPTSAPSPAPFYHACGSNWRNITTVYRRSGPSDCGGFSFFNDLPAAVQYWRVVAVHPALLSRRATTTKAQPAKPATGSAAPAAGTTHGRITGEAWSGVPVPADSELLRGLQPPSAKPAGTKASASSSAPSSSSALLRSLPFIHLIQYQVKPGPDGRPVPGRAEGVVQQLEALATESVSHVPGYKGWALLAAAPRPAGVTLGPWFDLAGFVPYPSEPVLEGYINYTAFHSTLHSTAVKQLGPSAHVMFETGRSSPDTLLFAPNFAALGSGSTGGGKPSG